MQWKLLLQCFDIKLQKHQRETNRNDLVINPYTQLRGIRAFITLNFSLYCVRIFKSINQSVSRYISSLTFFQNRSSRCKSAPQDALPYKQHPTPFSFWLRECDNLIKALDPFIKIEWPLDILHISGTFLIRPLLMIT